MLLYLWSNMVQYKSLFTLSQYVPTNRKRLYTMDISKLAQNNLTRSSQVTDLCLLLYQCSEHKYASPGVV